MSSIRKTIEVDATPETVWANVSDVGRISDLIGFLKTSVLDGNSRVCSLADGGTLTEKIITVDEDLKRVVYAITESPLNMEFHVAVMEVVPSGTGARMHWTIDLLPESAAEHMGPMLDSACEDMKITLAA